MADKSKTAEDAAAEVAGRRARKQYQAGVAADKARAAAHEAALAEQKAVDDAIQARIRDTDGDPVPITVEG